MYIHVVIAVTIAAFVWQLQLCCSRKGLGRLLPVGLLGGCILGLTLFSWIGNALQMPSAPFGAAVFAIVMMIPFGGAAMAWMAYGILRFVQNRRK